MSPAEVLKWAAASIGAAVAVVIILRIAWRGIGAYRIRRAGPRRLRARRHRIWRSPGVVEQLDLVGGPGGRGGAPVAPFRFVEEHASGSQPCVSVLDGRGRRWRVKWGPEVHSEVFAVRFAWACGYFAEETYFVPSGTIERCAPLARAKDCIESDGRFADARFELDDPAVRKLFEEHSWAWDDNPFVGTRELNGLKIVVMLLSNWDTKDRRDVARGSNTAIFEHRVKKWPRRWEARYLLSDWGGSMGSWGSNVITRGRWDAAAFAAQSAEFVTGLDGDHVRFGYAGQRTADLASGISTDDARWLIGFASRLTDAQLMDALAASGASEDEARIFARALRDRIDRLAAVTTVRRASPSADSAAGPAPVELRRHARSA